MIIKKFKQITTINGRELEATITTRAEDDELPRIDEDFDFGDEKENEEY